MESLALVQMTISESIHQLLSMGIRRYLLKVLKTFCDLKELGPRHTFLDFLFKKQKHLWGTQSNLSKLTPIIVENQEFYFYH